jgi:imidazolonepropionase-like amidohydrolase
VTSVIRCGTLFDGSGADPVRNATLVVEDGLIVDRPAPEGADVVELGELFVLPGLIDAHNHVSISIPLGDQWAQKREPAVAQALRAPYNLRKDLLGGTTTMRVMGEEDWIDLHVRDAIRAGNFAGPELICSTRPLSSGNGYGRITAGFDGVDELRRATRENLHHGADFIKVFATGGTSAATPDTPGEYSPAELAVIVEEAMRAGTYVAAHATGGQGLTDAIEAGVGTIEHASLATDQQIELLLDRDVWVVSTLSILFSPEGAVAGEPERASEIAEACVRVEERMRRVLTSGVRLALGTDHVHGNMAFEIQIAMRFGVSPKDALLAATSRGAEAIRVDHVTGSLVPGKRADLIALRGNPLEDPTALDRIEVVMQRGATVR